MRVRMLRDYSLGGKLYLEGLEVQVPDEVGRRLVQAGAAEVVEGSNPPAGLGKEEVEKLERLKREAEEERAAFPTWSPRLGWPLTGRVREIRTVDTKSGKKEVLVVDSDRGTYTVWRSPSTERFFRREIIGQTITIDAGQTWSPKPGEVLAGKIVGIEHVRTRFGRENDLLVVQTPEGRRFRVWRKAGLNGLFNQENVGKLVAIKYEGRARIFDRQTGRAKPFDKYTVKVG
jgi:hypothetical protein